GGCGIGCRWPDTVRWLGGWRLGVGVVRCSGGRFQKSVMVRVRLGEGGLGESIERRVGNGVDTFFWTYPGLGGVPLSVRYRRLFDLSTNQSSSVAEMCGLGWEEGGGVAMAPPIEGMGGGYIRGV
ncbi:hypothetical protein TSUD_426400, partial [Trifolium subterraneum]